ncbi:hypothetical protein [Xylocopilactobacillus apis]|uniref:Uncharacterized protein n=1 Tax=Xylocopilactobacillus apis TaxID=2932183 RepID=A0AAU9CZD7_9LACO|nr:hypothetical protein [Xylocopilactobacillus apis]BDR56769.1 hypothetical protein KIMC2_13310 [Xylocopilactobacillus apis]
MYFVRIAVEYPRENLRVLWSTNDKSKSEQPIIYKILNFIIDVFVGFLIIILVRETVPHNVVVNYFVGVSFAALFISLLIGNLIKPSLAVVEDTGSNE